MSERRSLGGAFVAWIRAAAKALVAIVGQPGRTRQAWIEAGAAAGLVPDGDPGSDWDRPTLRGLRDGVSLVLEIVLDGRGTTTRMTARGGGRWPASVSITSVQDETPERIVLTQDAGFDALAYYSGDANVLSELLTPEARRAIARWLEECARSASIGRIADGDVVVERRRLETDPAWTRWAAESTSALAASLIASEPRRAPASTDSADLRLAKLRKLVEDPAAQHSGELARACRRALTDRDPEIRLLAASHAGAPGRAALEALARSESVPGSIRRRAFHSWRHGRRPSHARGVGGESGRPGALATDLLHSTNAELRREAIEVVLPHADAALVVELATEIRDAPRATIVEWCDRVSAPHPKVESTLRALVLSGSEDVIVHAIRALERVGTAESVSRLREVERDFLLFGGAPRAAAAKAIAAIASRDAAPQGSLSLDGEGGEAGELSHDDRSGEVSEP